MSKRNSQSGLQAKAQAKVQIDQSILHLLHRAQQCVGEAYAKAAGSNSLTPRQHILLAAIAAHPGANQTVLRENTGIDRSTMAEMLRRLETRGLVRQLQSKADRRAYVITLTGPGERAVKNAEPTASVVEDEILAVLGPRQKSRLLKDLEALVKRFHADGQTV